MPQETILGRILSPLSVADFASRYFQRRALFVRGQAHKFDFLFRHEEFIHNLDRATEIRVVFANLWQATIDPPDINEMLQAGGTICVTGMEKAHQRLEKAARRIKEELGYTGKVSFRAYLSPPTAGFDLHFDARVATTLQIAGTKRWWYSVDPAIPFPESNSPRPLSGKRRKYNIPRQSQLKSVLLRPGDLLCLPAGAWHRAKAGDTSLALNLAFDHGGSSVFDVIVDILEDRIKSDPTWRVPLPVAEKKRRQSAATDVTRILRERIDALTRVLTSIRRSDRLLKRAWLERIRSG